MVSVGLLSRRFGLLSRGSEYISGAVSLRHLECVAVAGDLSNELVRHFLIESSPKGVKLKGCPNEPYFGEWKPAALTHLPPSCHPAVTLTFSCVIECRRVTCGCVLVQRHVSPRAKSRRQAVKAVPASRLICSS